MGRDELIKMAQEAGLEPGYYTGKSEDDFVMFAGIAAFANMVAAFEREECAKVAEIPNMAQSDIARVIRGRNSVDARKIYQF